MRLLGQFGRNRTRMYFGLILLIGVSACAELNLGQEEAEEELPEVQISTPELLERGEAALAAESYKEAENAFQEVFKRDPESTKASFGLAETYYETEQYNRATRLYEHVLKNSTQDNMIARSEMGIGLINFLEGDLDAGEKRLKKAVVKKPSLWRAWLALGRIHEQNEKTDSASKAYKMAEKHGSNQAIVHNNVGMWHLSSRNTEAAEKSFNRALELSPGLKEAAANIRLVHATNREYEKAISGAAEDEMPAVLNNVGYIAILNADYDVAERYLNEAITLSPFYNTAAIANLQLLKDTQDSIPRGR